MRGAKIVAAAADVAPAPDDDSEDDDDEGSISLAWAKGGKEEEGSFSVPRNCSWSSLGVEEASSSSFLVEVADSNSPILEMTEAVDSREEAEMDRGREAHFVVSFSREDDFGLDDSF